LKNLRLTDDKQEKVIILLTDGESNDGSISLNQAIKMAADEGIKTYTIGVGTTNELFRMLSLSTPGVDEQALHALADITNGQYYRAENTSGLQKIYQLIDKLEPRLQDERYIRETTELYYIPLLIAIIISLFLAYALREKK
jgi:Ca-activated chloride channel family protein